MRKAFLLLLASFFSLLSFAQSSDDSVYGMGNVPEENGKVTFTRTIALGEVSVQTAGSLVNSWAKGRFVSPIVISGKFQKSGQDGIVVSAEEYIYFKKTAFITDRTRINYTLSVSFSESSCKIKVTDISYWYEEDVDGGKHFTAEDWITDSEAFNRNGTKMLKTTGKFRIKTIDLVNSFEKEIEEVITPQSK